MDNRKLTNEEVSALINHVLDQKGPELTGLKTVLKARQAPVGNLPLKSISLNQFGDAGQKRPLKEEERRILELEKTVVELRQALAKQKEQAQRDITLSLEQGREEGRAEGFAQGNAQATALFERRVSELQTATATTLRVVETSKQSLYSQALETMIRLALEAARKVINTELTLDISIVAATIKRALGYIADRDKLVIRVSPEEVDVAQEKIDFWGPVSEKLSNISIVADSGVGKGGCIIESSTGVADARLNVQFSELADIIEKSWQGIMAHEDAS